MGTNYNWFNWRTFLAITAIVLVSSTIFYSNYLARKIAKDERLKIEQWAEAVKLNSTPDVEFNNLSARILTENSKDIPIILVTEKDSVLDYRNLDTFAIKNNSHYLVDKIAAFKALHPSIDWTNPSDKTQVNKIYYGESDLLNEVRYYPFAQLILVALFITIIVIAKNTSAKSEKNRLWAGMAKETAHQLGTPVSSLGGWVEILKTENIQESLVVEVEKDVERLQLISDRFGKIGSTPVLEEKDLVQQVSSMADYMRKRASGKVAIELIGDIHQPINVLLSAPLLDWVIENLLKNALDSMEGKGHITVNIINKPEVVQIDITDTGKGIDKHHIKKVFEPGFTTKKRGWGLGLALAKRIICEFHHGNLSVVHSEVNKGTTFRIQLNK